MTYLYYIIAVLLAVDNVFIRFRFLGMSYDRWLEFIIFLFLLNPYLEELRQNKFFRKWNIFLLVFALLQLLINFRLSIEGKIEFTAVYTEFLKCISFLVFSFLFLLIAKKHVKYINAILAVHFIICLFAILQHPLSPIAAQMLDIKKFLYSTDISQQVAGKLDTEEAYISGGFASRFRLSGPFASAISYSYFAITSFVLSLYMYLNYRRPFYIILLSLLFISSLLTQTRSLILAEIFIILGYLFFMPTKIKGITKITMAGLGILILAIVYSGRDILIPQNTRVTQISSEGKEDTRPYLWLTGIRTVMEYPLGLTSADYQKVRNEMAIILGKPYVLFLASHNGLINIGFQYSIFGYIIFAIFTAFLLKSVRSLPPNIRLFFKLVMVGYLIHCSFHNNFIFLADYNILMIVMLIGLEQYNTQISNYSDSSSQHFIS